MRSPSQKISLVFVVCVLKALSIEDRKLVFLPKIFLENILKVPDLPLCVPKLPVGIIEGFSGGFGSRNQCLKITILLWAMGRG